METCQCAKFRKAVEDLKFFTVGTGEHPSQKIPLPVPEGCTLKWQHVNIVRDAEEAVIREPYKDFNTNPCVTGEWIQIPINHVSLK